MKEYFVCKLTTGEEIDFNKKAKTAERSAEDEYVVYDETGNMIGIIRADHVICFYQTNDKCEEKRTALDGNINERKC